jgi:hypothetical protein
MAQNQYPLEAMLEDCQVSALVELDEATAAEIIGKLKA